MSAPDTSDSPGVIAPPPLIYGAFLALGLVLDYLWAGPAFPHLLRAGLGGLLILSGLGLAAWAVLQFRKLGTHVDVRKPATALATAGPYRVSRNPIYLALTLFYLGIGLAVGSLWVLVLVVPALLVMHLGVIRREERYLERTFGAAYLDYARQVRRWI